MWRRQEVHRDFFWIGLLVGLTLGGLLGVLLGTEAGRTTRVRLEKAAQKVRGRFNGTSKPQDPPVEAEAADSEE